MPSLAAPSLRALLMVAITATAILPVAALAETRYVTDRLEVTLRAGESTRYKILRMLPSGTPMEVLGVNKSTNYARVRIQDGTVGFVLAQELQDEPAARNRLAELEERLDRLRQEPDALTTELANLQETHAELRERFAALEREKQQREQELATIRHASANVLDITSDRERLRLQVAELHKGAGGPRAGEPGPEKPDQSALVHDRGRGLGGRRADRIGPPPPAPGTPQDPLGDPLTALP